MKSLRGSARLVLVLSFSVCWIAGGGALLAYTAQADHSIWDAKLEAFATKLMMAIPADKVDEGPFGPGLELPPAKPGARENFSIQVWSGNRMFIQSPGVPSQPFRADGKDGFATTIVDGKKWRVYAVSDRTGRVSVQVANLQSVIDWEMQQEALIALSLLTIVLVLVGFLQHFVISRSLKPITALGTAVLRRKKFDLTPLPVNRLPRELQPLVVSFNHVLLQLDEAVDAERRFIGDAAHELRTPLAALQAQAEVALGAATPEEKDAALVKLLAVARRSTRLAEQLLDLARLDAGVNMSHQVPADMGQLIDHVVHEYDFQAAQGERQLIVDAGPCRIVGDIDQIAILLRNLVDNALRFAPRGGRVRIACGHVDAGAGLQPYLEVADDGPGVPASERELIFKRFHRIDHANNARGSGVGLSLVAGIARLHQASIDTGDGIDGRGFCVRVRFAMPPTPASETV